VPGNRCEALYGRQCAILEAKVCTEVLPISNCRWSVLSVASATAKSGSGYEGQLRLAVLRWHLILYDP
jgi:hypothetical protein